MRWWMLLVGLGGCPSDGGCEGDGGSVEVLCEAEGCSCGSGPNEGRPCEEEECETFCLACEDTDQPLVLP